MATIAEFSQLMSTIANRDVIYQFLFDEIKKAEQFFVKAQQDQLNKGENNEGGIIGTYSFASEQIAKGKNTRKPKIAGEPFNYEDSGSFFDNMYLQVEEHTATFWSKDSKTPLLVSKYDDLFGLTKPNLEILIRNIIYPALMSKMRRVLKLI